MMPHVVPLLAENALFRTVGDIFHPLFIAIATVLAWIYSAVPNYAAAIVILTVLIMALLTPLTVKSTRSMTAMQALQPEMQKLRAKYKGAENREQLNQEMMALYREHGVSPTGGCLPMFLQMPALIVLYDAIRGLANTVKRGTKLATGKICHATICGTPHYVPRTSTLFHNLKSTPGVMHSIGLNLAAKPLTHRANWYDYIPYFALLAVAVGLQYFQMAQMTRRNKKNGQQQQQVPQQMQQMQKFMPLIFAYIYFLVPAGVVIYMIVSSAIRILTQDLIFRYGMNGPGGSRQVSGGKAPREKPPAVGPSSAASAPKPLPTGGPKGGSAGGGARAPGPRRPTGRAAKAATNGSTNDATAPKPHPRSKSKRERKAR